VIVIAAESLHPGWRIIGLLLATAFFAAAGAGLVRGYFSDPETGLCDRRKNPVWFWLTVPW
jgi:hypothetical protein